MYCPVVKIDGFIIRIGWSKQGSSNQKKFNLENWFTRLHGGSRMFCLFSIYLFDFRGHILGSKNLR